MGAAFRSPSSLLPWLLLLAAGHALAAALVRPLFQVSDEVNYLASAQRAALAMAPVALAACVSPPDGRPPAAMPVGGKPLFHATAGRALVSACAAGAGAAAPVWTRLAFGLNLVLVTGVGWAVARLVHPDPWVAATTALLLATQPVLAKYAGAITPDSLANAAAAIAVWGAVRWLVRGPSVVAGLGMLAASGTAAAFKDTALVLVPVHGLVMAAALVRPSRAMAGTIPRLLTGAVIIVIVATVATMTRTSYPVGPGVAQALDTPVPFVLRVLGDFFTQFPGQVTSSWTSLGGFGALSAPLPSVVGVVVAGGLALALFGGLRAAVRQDAPVPGPVSLYAALLSAACLLQAPVRQVLLDMQDQHQGRWLFPAAVPIAVIVATGLAAALGTARSRAWPLVAMACVTVGALSGLSVAAWHVGPGGRPDPTHLFVRATGGLDVDDARIAAQATAAWDASGGVAPLVPLAFALLACGVRIALFVPGSSTTHDRHAHDR